jgi:glycerol kinase
MKYILALDQGTTSSRAIVFDHDGNMRSLAQKEIKPLYPRPGWVEQDCREIWSSQIEVAGEALHQAGLTAKDIDSIGIANQRETTLVWDRFSGEPVHNAIVWQDRRTAGNCEKLKGRGVESLFREKTGLLIDPYFSGTKLSWLLENIPRMRRRAESGELLFGTVDSWLLWNLTGGKEHRTDVSNASRTLIFNIHTLSWDEELLEMLRIPAAMLPQVNSTSMIHGETAEGLFASRIPVAAMSGDQQAALLGQGCTIPGMAKNTYGTGCFMLINTGDSPVTSRNRLVSTVAWEIDGKTEYALEGSIFTAGGVVQWLRDGLGIIRSSSEVEHLASTVPDNGGVFLVPAFSGLGAPHWDPYARGTITGITRGSTAAHIARAALESIAFQVADLLASMGADTGTPLTELRVDGGATVNNLLMQIQADLLGIPVIRPGVPETTALGAAYMAGLATGYWKGLDEITRQWKSERVFTPSMEETKAAGLRRQWQRALERARGWEAPPHL